MKCVAITSGLTVFLLLCPLVGQTPCAQPLGDLPHVAARRVPLLPLPAGGREVAVSTAEELAAAVAQARDGDVILLADGSHRVGRPLTLDKSG